MDLWVLVVGLLMLVVALPVAGRRVFFLFRLITSGQPAPDRVENVTKRLGAAARSQVVEVFAQRKLLKWSVPGAAHFFVFWAFLILGTVYLEAFGILFSRNEEWAIPVVGHWDALGFAQDFIAVMCLVGLATFAMIRLRNDPHKLGRKSRFSGSHLGGAWVILAMIVNVIWTMFLFRGAAATGEEPEENLPYGAGAFMSQAIGELFGGLSEHALEILEGVGLLLHIGVMLAFLVIVLNSKHLHIFVAPLNVLFKREPVALGAVKPLTNAGQAGHARRRRRPRRGRHARRRVDRGLQLEGPARHGDLHRVRSLPVAVPGVEHREAALSQDADHEPPRPRVREGAVHAGRRGRPGQAAGRRPGRGGAAAGRRDRGSGVGARPAARSSTPTCCGRA